MHRQTDIYTHPIKKGCIRQGGQHKLLIPHKSQKTDVGRQIYLVDPYTTIIYVQGTLAPRFTYCLRPDLKASWKNVNLYGVHIFQFQRTDKMDSVMKGLTGQRPLRILGQNRPCLCEYNLLGAHSIRISNGNRTVKELNAESSYHLCRPTSYQSIINLYQVCQW